MVKVGMLYNFMNIYCKKKWLVVETKNLIRDLRVLEFASDLEMHVKYNGAGRDILKLKTRQSKRVEFKTLANGKVYRVLIEVHPNPRDSKILFVVDEDENRN